MGDGVVDGRGGGFEEVGEADVEDAFAQADGGVEGSEAAETDVEGGWGAGAEVAVLLLEDAGDEGGGLHGEFSLTCEGVEDRPALFGQVQKRVSTSDRNGTPGDERNGQVCQRG